LARQTAGAFLGDMGITSTQHPKQTCTETQVDCLASPQTVRGDGPEIDDKALSDVVFYQSILAPPTRRRVNDSQVKLGQALFFKAQCHVCHRPNYTTTAPPFPRLSSDKLHAQTVKPYSDFLLHDMGPALADGRPDYPANGQQWKTPPLWGLGLRNVSMTLHHR
jgi:CxxC motif-containing protein (DUF1111 family)